MLLGHITSNLSQFLFFLLQALFLRTQIPCHAIQIKNSLLFRASFRQRRRFFFSFLESVATFDLCIKRKWIFCKFKMLDHGTIKNLFKNSRIFTIHCFFSENNLSCRYFSLGSYWLFQPGVQFLTWKNLEVIKADLTRIYVSLRAGWLHPLCSWFFLWCEPFFRWWQVPFRIWHH